MDITQANRKLIDDLRAWFFAKDRSVILPNNSFFEGEETSTPVSPPHNRGRLYWKNGIWTQLDEFGTETPLLGTWVNWFPTVTQSVAVLATVVEARYKIKEDDVRIYCQLNVTGTGTAGNPITVAGWPAVINPNPAPGAWPVGAGVIVDTGVGSYMGTPYIFSSTSVRLLYHSTLNNVGANPNFGLVSGDFIHLNMYWKI